MFPLPRPARRAARAAAAVLTALAALTGLALPAGATTAPAPAPVPPAATGLPAGIEDLATYVPASSCDPVTKPGATALGNLLRATYPGTSYGVDRACGSDPLPTSEHYEGRALDWFISARDTTQAAKVQALFGWLFAADAAGHPYANARRLGIMYMIWDDRIWGAYRPGDGWRPYSTCAAHPEAAYDTTCHRDHVHFSLSWAGAMGRTSYWTKQVAANDYGPCRPADLNWAAPYSGANPTPCPDYPVVSAAAGASALDRSLTTFSGMVLRTGSTGPAVSAVQQAVGAGVDGGFGPLTAAAVSTWQGGHHLPATGVVDAATWRALLAAFAPKPAPAPSPGGGPVGAPPAPAPAPVPAPVPVPAPKPAPAPAPKPAPRPVSALARYRGTVLRAGSRGAAVAALQRALHLSADGVFGPRTRAAVLAFQRAHHLPTTGVVAALTWRALGA